MALQRLGPEGGERASGKQQRMRTCGLREMHTRKGKGETSPPPVAHCRPPAVGVGSGLNSRLQRESATAGRWCPGRTSPPSAGRPCRADGQRSLDQGPPPSHQGLAAAAFQPPPVGVSRRLRRPLSRPTLPPAFRLGDQGAHTYLDQLLQPPLAGIALVGRNPFSAHFAHRLHRSDRLGYRRLARPLRQHTAGFT